MIELFTAPTPNGWKVSIMLEECGLPYRVRTLDLGKGEQLEPWYREICPNSRIPAIVDDGVRVFESGAILHYLAEKSGRFLPGDPAARWEVLQWLHWQMGGVGPMVGQSISFNRYIEPPIPYAIARYAAESRRLYEVLDHRLEGREYVCGEASIADFALYPWVRAHKWARVSIDGLDHLRAWQRRVRARPGVDRGLAVGVPDGEVDQWSEERKAAYKRGGASMVTLVEPEPIYHLAPISEFRAALRGDRYEPPRLPGDGFVHCAHRPSVLDVARDYLGESAEPVLVLEIDPSRLSAEVLVEAPAPLPGGGTSHLEGASEFPHVYGPLDVDAIVGVGVLGRAAPGAGSGFTWPDRFDSAVSFLTSVGGDPAFERLTSERLVVRRFRPADAGALARYRSDPEVARYQGWGESWSLEQAERFIEGLHGLSPGAPGAWFQFAVALADSDRLIGDCALRCDAADPRLAELGFSFGRDHQGQGYASEAVRCVLDYGFGELGLHRVCSYTDLRNRRAQRLLERLGFRREAELQDSIWSVSSHSTSATNGEWASERLYAQLREEWERRISDLA
ncbi:MAG: GNAT family N-acetyltransferase [Proteobacteria bacterium]|nr:GNAT family N-acetyltransferase [Pseudomonadota bacterium]